ncbi:MAG: hypothetical protein BGO98_28870 [Myxococcales bacterium 68-20]|nr:hypothetical protein [Myxococcales bacterium]OJY30782.1 MAG: hypothetical protein BGO98_28870 [Myxococcales bacterium 68-20]
MSSRLAVVSCLLLLSACGGSTSPAPTTPAAPAESGATPPAPGSGEGGSALTAEECEKQGGRVVGDIGDGATHRPDYRCPDSGQPPIGRIKFEPSKPVALEGAVCCR